MLESHRNATRSPLTIDVRPPTAASRGVTRYNAPHTSAVGTSDAANAFAPSGSISRRYQRARPPSAPHGLSRTQTTPKLAPGPFRTAQTPRISDQMFPKVRPCTHPRDMHGLSFDERGSKIPRCRREPHPLALSPAACDTGAWGRADGKGRGLVPPSLSQAAHGRARRSFPRCPSLFL